MKTVQKAVTLSVSEIANPDPGALKLFDCVYAGDEFCQVKLPSAAGLLRLRASFKGGIVLASPVMTDKWLGKFRELAGIIGAWGNGAGVVVNDIGALRYLCGLKRFRPEISLGRVLASSFGFFAASSWFKKFFGGRVSSVEIDDKSGLGVYSAARGLRLNLHFPMRFVSFSRHCYISKTYNDKCRKECRAMGMARVYPGPLKNGIFLYGNALFCDNRPVYLKKGGLSAILRSGLNVGRIVFNSGLKDARGFLRESPGLMADPPVSAE